MGSQRRKTWSRKIQEALVREHDIDDAMRMMFKRLRLIPSLRGASDDQIIDILSQFLHKLLTGHPFENAPGLQRRTIPDLTAQDCRNAIQKVLDNREVAHHIIFGLTGDMYGEKFRPFRATVRSLLMIVAAIPILKRFIPFFVPANRTVETLNVDYPLYGVDETLGQWIGCLYGVFGFEMFGFLDASKLDIIKEIDEADGCHVFLDDLICGIIAAAYAMLWTRYCSIGHGYQETYARSRELVNSWLDEYGLHLDDLVEIVHKRQSGYFPTLSVSRELCEEGFTKVLSKSEIYELLMLVKEQQNNLTNPYTIEVCLLTYASSINQKYGTIGKSNIGVFTYRLPAPLDQIKDRVVLYVIAAIVADTNGYVAHELESRLPKLQEVVQTIWADAFRAGKAWMKRIVNS